MSNLKRYTLYILNLIDVLSGIFSYLAAFYFRFIMFHTNEYSVTLTQYRDYMLVMALSYVLINITVLYNEHEYLTRSLQREIISVLKTTTLLYVFGILILNLLKANEHYSRTFELLYFCCYFFIDLGLRMFAKKKLIPGYKEGAGAEKVILITPYREADKVLKKVKYSEDWRYLVTGIVITDRDMASQYIEGIEVISNRRRMFDDIIMANADSVLIMTGNERQSTIQKWMNQFRELGKIVHVQVSEYDWMDTYRIMDKVGDCAVVTFNEVRPMARRKILLRRILNVLGAVAAFPFFVAVSLAVLILTEPESPGSILVSRLRVGRGGHTFNQYRYRLMRYDAIERISRGESPYTFAGKILKATHLDGLPGVINILFGEMNFVGPRALSIDQFLESTSLQRNFLRILPGICGYWSCVKDVTIVFDEEQDYIEKWNILKDLEILAIMTAKYLTLHSTRAYTPAMYEEELTYIQQAVAQKKNYEYDSSTYQARTDRRYVLYQTAKRAMDIILSLLSIVVLSPLFLILSILVLADDGGTPFYGHERIGMHGKHIKVYKFRSMRRDAGDLKKLLSPEQLEQYYKEFKLDNDPRITPIGNFLRKSSLDELPQLFNILFGTLSFVGPRPVVEAELEYYGKDTAKFLSIRPGLTGYWQTYARNKATYESGIRQKMEMYYIDHQSIWLDIKIFFHTFGSVIREDGAE